jgi:biotin transporter BioY
VGPTGGYLVGFVAGAYIVGALFERMKKVSYLSVLSALLLGNAAIFALGLPWLSLWTGASSVLALGLYPFVVGDLLKAAVLASYLRSR